MRLIPLLLLLLCPALPPAAQEAPTLEELEAWLNEESKEPGGPELRFLATPPAEGAPHARNALTLSTHSLEEGFVALEQCWSGLDPVPDMEVLYRYERMRGLRVSRAEGIGETRVEGQSVRMRDVGRGATLCVTAEVAILHRQADGSYRLRNGPFLRKFLDGYFPFHLTLTVAYPDDLALTAVTPETQPGVTIEKGPGRLTLEAWFEGELTTELRFQPR